MLLWPRCPENGFKSLGEDEKTIVKSHINEPASSAVALEEPLILERTKPFKSCKCALSMLAAQASPGSSCFVHHEEPEDPDGHWDIWFSKGCGVLSADLEVPGNINLKRHFQLWTSEAPWTSQNKSVSLWSPQAVFRQPAARCGSRAGHFHLQNRCEGVKNAMWVKSLAVVAVGATK